MIDNQGKKKAARAFAATFAESLAASMANSLGSPWPIEVVDNLYPSTSKEKPVHFRLTVDGSLEGECFVEFYEDQVSSLLAQIKKKPVADVTDDDGVELINAITAAMHLVVASLADDYGKISFKVDRAAGLAFGGMLVVPLTCSAATDASSILLYFDGALVDALSATAAGSSDEADGHTIHPHNLKLVMDVELNVSLRFGQRSLPLREVLELSSGSVIELDRLVDEPVDLFLDGKLIARGEAVIVDGNYGLRVTEIPQPVASHLFG
jgi:flagellar motor switch protein FliN/FliY